MAKLNSWDRYTPAMLLAGGIAAGLFASRLTRRSHRSLDGRCVLITGGSRGLGLRLAHEFARAGANLAICARDTQELERAKEDLAGYGVDVLSLECDLTSNNEVQRTVQTATDHYGQIDILVNNAGVITVGPLSSMSESDFKYAMDVMFWGTLWPSLAVLPQMRERRDGQIVNITSIGGKISVPHLLPYCCAKFAAVALSEGMHAELERDGITVTTVVPGLMRTGSHLNANFKGGRNGEFSVKSKTKPSAIS